MGEKGEERKVKQKNGEGDRRGEEYIHILNFDFSKPMLG